MLKMNKLFWLTLMLFAGALELPQALAGEFALDFGGSVEHFAYVETLTAPAKSTETANMVNGLLGFRYMMSAESWLQVHALGSRGVKSTYIGSTLDTNQPVTAINPLEFTNYEFLFYFPIANSISLHFGYGARVWDRYLSGNPGYREIYSWNYTPVGIDFSLYRGAATRFWFELSARPTSAGKIKVITSKTVTNGVDSEIDLGAHTGYRASFPVQWKISSALGLEVTPFIEHSEIGESKVVANATLAPTPGTGISEPASKTDRSGIDLVFVLNF